MATALVDIHLLMSLLCCCQAKRKVTSSFVHNRTHAKGEIDRVSLKDLLNCSCTKERKELERRDARNAYCTTFKTASETRKKRHFFTKETVKTVAEDIKKPLIVLSTVSPRYEFPRISCISEWNNTFCEVRKFVLVLLPM